MRNVEPFGDRADLTPGVALYRDDARAATRLTFTIGVLMMLAPFSIDTYLPSLPDIARDLAAADWQVQQTLSLYLIAFAGTTLIYGPLSDAFGRRAVVISSLALYAAASFGCVFATGIEWLVAMRLGQGLSASGPIVVGRAIVRDAFSGAQAQRAMSKAMVLFSVAPAVAPIVGGYLQTAYGWRSVFWFLTALAIILWVWTVWTLPETLAVVDRRPAHPRSLGLAYARALVHGQFMLLVSSIALCFGGLFIYVAGSPTLLYRGFGYRPDQFWYLFLPIVAGFIVGASLSSRLAGHRSHAYAVNVGFALMLTAATGQLMAS
jgi:DHA1 family bicyclomycin/chloramphenicol resistance-like MFS transporter